VREAWNVRFGIAEGGRERARVNAAYLAAYEGDSTYTVLQGAEGGGTPVSVQLFDAAGRPSATVTADRVVYREAARQMTAQGSVVVRASGGRTLQAERLLWDEATGRVRAPGAVRYASPTEQVTGTDLDADENLVSYTIRNVTASVTLQ
jgi:lipopolysaccharide assembly outer membrane protein LptD (OstA)